MILCFDHFKDEKNSSLLAAYLIKRLQLTAEGKVPNRGENDDGESESETSEVDENYNPSSDQDDDHSSSDSAGI